MKLTCEARNWRRYSSLPVLATLIALSLFAGMHESYHARSSSPNVSISDAHRTFWLKGSAISGWNSSSPGPTITVSSGDKVTIMLLSADAPDVHDWYVTANVSATKSPNFSSGTAWFNWTFAPIIGINIPHGGDWIYLCLYHQAIMRGTFRILPVATFTNSPASPTVGELVSFDASASKPSIGGSITTNSWNFGDGNKTSTAGAMINHSYSAPGSFNVSLTIADNESNTDTTSEVINIVSPGINISANPTTDSVLINSHAISTITVASNGSFTGKVVFSETSSPSGGLTCIFVPTNVTLGSSATSSLSCSSTNPVTYAVTVFATGGKVGNLTAITFSFQDFQINASSPNRVNPGVSATSTVTITSFDGFVGVVQLEYSAPSGVSCGLITPSSITGEGTATISCSTVSVGNYTVTVTGVAGITHTSSFVLEVIQAPGTGTGLSINDLLEIGVGVSAAIVVVATLIFLRRKRSSP